MIGEKENQLIQTNSLAQFPSEAMEVEGPSPEGPLDALAPGLEQLTRHPCLYAMDCTHTESCTSLLEYTHTLMSNNAPPLYDLGTIFIWCYRLKATCVQWWSQWSTQPNLMRVYLFLKQRVQCLIHLNEMLWDAFRGTCTIVMCKMIHFQGDLELDMHRNKRTTDLKKHAVENIVANVLLVNAFEFHASMLSIRRYTCSLGGWVVLNALLSGWAINWPPLPNCGLIRSRSHVQHSQISCEAMISKIPHRLFAMFLVVCKQVIKGSRDMTFVLI